MIKRFTITAEALKSFFTAGRHDPYTVTDGARPENVRIERVNMVWAIEGQRFEFLLSSPDFAAGPDDLTTVLQRVIEDVP